MVKMKELLQKAKAKYVKACADYEKATLDQRAADPVATKPKDMEKLRTRVANDKVLADQAHDGYKQQVSEHRAFQSKFEEQFRHILEQFGESEMKRREQVKEVLQQFLNTQDHYARSMTETVIPLRAAQEALDSGADLQAQLEAKKTGLHPEPLVEYEPYVTDSQVDVPADPVENGARANPPAGLERTRSKSMKPSASIDTSSSGGGGKKDAAAASAGGGKKDEAPAASTKKDAKDAKDVKKNGKKDSKDDASSAAAAAPSADEHGNNNNNTEEKAKKDKKHERSTSASTEETHDSAVGEGKKGSRKKHHGEGNGDASATTTTTTTTTNEDTTKNTTATAPGAGDEEKASGGADGGSGSPASSKKAKAPRTTKKKHDLKGGDTPASPRSPTAATSGAGDKRPPVAKALFDYEATDQTEIDFVEGDLIIVTLYDGEVPDCPGWMKGKCKGKEGLFPANHAELLPEAKLCKATFDFEVSEPEELALKEGEILIIEATHEDWYEGRNEKGEAGIFPSTYVALL